MQARLFIGNLSWNTTEADLSDLVSAHAEVVEAKVISDYDTGRSRGFGFVTIETDRVQDVIMALNGQELDGRALRVNEAEDKPRRTRDSYNAGYRDRDGRRNRY